MPLAQNNFYAKVAYLGMAYTGILQKHWVFPGGSDGKQSAYNVGDPGSIPGLRRTPGQGTGNPLQYSCLGNPMDRGAYSVNW